MKVEVVCNSQWWAVLWNQNFVCALLCSSVDVVFLHSPREANQVVVLLAKQGADRISSHVGPLLELVVL